MLIIGHRGASLCSNFLAGGYEDENTLLSFERAISFGVDAIELDVHQCKTGEIVVIHDDTVDRTTNGSGFVRDKSLGEISNLTTLSGQKISTLKEVLDFVNGRVVVNIELKGVGSALAVAQIIEEYQKNGGWSENLFWVSSFDHRQLFEFSELAPKIKIGALYEGVPLDYAKFGVEFGAEFIGISLEFVSKEFVDDAHKLGLKIFVYTVDKKEDKDRLKAFSVDGIFTNCPQVDK